MKSPIVIRILAGLALLTLSAHASESLQYNTSASQAYNARSILTNPAALGFQTDLNGMGLFASQAYGVQKGLQDEFSTALGLGYFGFAYERLQQPLGDQKQWHFGVGLPITSYWYAGARYRFTTSDTPLLDGQKFIDLGLQIRPHPRFSLGVLVNGLNRPDVGGAEKPEQYTLSSTVRFFDQLDLSADLYTPGDHFLRTLSAQAMAGWEFARGVKIFGGFHTERKVIVGLQVNLGYVSLFSSGFAGGEDQALMTGIQLVRTPTRSAWMPNTALKVEVDPQLSETPARGGLLGVDRPSLWQLLDRLHEAAQSPQVKLVSVRLDDFGLGMAAAQDLYDALWELRKQGKQVEVYLASADLKEYLIASAANRIILEPTAELRFPGIRGQRYYFKGLLDKAGVEGEFFARGEYKSAPEAFTRKDSSAINRAETLRELKVVEETLIRQLGQGRKFTAREWALCHKEALVGAKRAKELGLVDDIGHFQADFEKRTVGLSVRTDLKELSDALALPRRVAIVIARGNILKNEIKFLSVAGETQVTPGRLEKQFQQALNDPYTDAVVLRVSSPGGEVLASDEMAASVKRTNEKKPVVVSMGDVAASGGYFIAAPAARIFAQPLTVTGSIGVFLGKFSFKKLYEKIDINKEILTYGPYPGLLSEDRPWSDAERKVMLRRLDEYYSDFVAHVGLYRHLSPEDAEKAAKGRVILGAEAESLKIIDAQGGYRASVEAAAKLAGLTEGHYIVRVIQDRGGLADLIGEDTPFAALPPPAETLLKDLSRYSFLGEQRFLYWSPYSLLE